MFFSALSHLLPIFSFPSAIDYLFDEKNCNNVPLKIHARHSFSQKIPEYKRKPLSIRIAGSEALYETDY